TSRDLRDERKVAVGVIVDGGVGVVVVPVCTAAIAVRASGCIRIWKRRLKLWVLRPHLFILPKGQTFPTMNPPNGSAWENCSDCCEATSPKGAKPTRKGLFGSTHSLTGDSLLVLSPSFSCAFTHFNSFC